MAGTCEDTILRTKIPDPLTSAAAHGNTLAILYVHAGVALFFCLVMYGLLECCGRQIYHQYDRESDHLYYRFLFLYGLGFGGAAVSTQLLPADGNWGMRISKIVIILAWAYQAATFEMSPFNGVWAP